jgi:hypothetical protein
VKPVILSVGNCLVEYFLGGVRDLSVGTEYFEYVASRGGAALGREPLDPQILARCRLLIEETSPWQRMLSGDERAQLPATCKRITVPTLHVNSLWPLMVADPRNKPIPPVMPWGVIPFTHGDRLALDIMEREADPARRLEAYLATDLSTVVDLARHHQLSVDSMFAAEAGCDVRVAAYVVSNFREKRLFYMQNHASSELMGFALLQILGHPAILEISGRPLHEAVESVEAWKERNLAALATEAAPIHPAVAAYFDLKWYRADLRYPWQHIEYTFEQWLEFYFAYEAPAS